MKKKIFTLLTLALMSIGTAWASTVSDLKTISSNYTFICDDFTSNGTVGLTNGTLYDSGRFLPVGNQTATSAASNKGKSTIGGVEHLNSLRLKNNQDQYAIKVDGLCKITFYTQSNSSRGVTVGTTKRGDNTDCDEYGQQTASTSTWSCNVTAAGVVYMASYGGDFYFAGFDIAFPANISTHPVSAVYSTGASTDALTVVATKMEDDNVLSYQWYSCDDADGTNPVEIVGATSASYDGVSAAADGTFYYFCTVTEKTSSDALVAAKNSKVATITVSSAAAPTISNQPTNQSELTNVDVTFSVVAMGTPAPTYQWYSCDDALKTNATLISGATEASYTVSKAAAGTYYFYVNVSNSEGNVDSEVATFTVNARTGKALNQAVFSNSFDSFINAGAYTVNVYYMEGESQPTLTSYVASEGATADLSGTTLTVTAEDGSTQDYAVTFTAVTPHVTTGAVTFDGTETWIKTGYTFDATKKWRFAKTDDNWERERDGRTRIYFFVGPAKSLSLTTTTGQTPRNIKVYVNGVQYGGITKQADAGNSISIPCNETANNMVAIVSNQTGGDGGFEAANLDNTVSVTITAAEYATFVPSAKVSVPSGVKAYAVTAASDAGIVLSAEDDITVIGANAPVIINGAAGTYYFPMTTADASASTNLLVAGPIAAGDSDGSSYYVLGQEGSKVGFGKLASGIALPETKAYLSATYFSTSAPAFVPFFFGDDNVVTGVNDVRIKMAEVKGEVYNLNGQRVAQPTKGLYIVNGRKVVVK